MKTPCPGPSRRVVIKGAGALLAAPVVMRTGSVLAASRTIRLGYVAPRSGPLGPITEGDPFVLQQVRDHMAGRIEIAGETFSFEIFDKDTQSDANRAAEVAADLILKDEVDLMLVGSTPDTTNPVSDQCEANGVPCISSATPWQPWFFGRGGVPGETVFRWTNHFFWGAEDLTKVYLELWETLPTNKVVGGLWPNDPDGIAFSDEKLGFPSALRERGFTVVDSGRYQNLKDDFSAEIARFKSANVEIVTGVMLPPDLATFMVQAKQQAFHPKIVTVAKAALIPKGIEAFPDGLGENLSGEVYWGPQYPFKSSLTGQTDGEITQAYEAATGKQWLQGLGYSHALFEVGIDALRRTKEVSPNAIMEAVNATDLQTCVGHVRWGDFKPFVNVAKTPLAAGQWQKGTTTRYELVVTNNGFFPAIEKNGDLKVKTW